MRGADALALAKQYQPTAISLDVFLPDMLGWTVLSQLKQNPPTRHIPVQIVTLDEDRQHGLARGAFSFVTKPTTSEGIEDALARIKDFAQPRRKRLLVVEDNAAEQLSIPELLGHDDIEIVGATTGAEALAVLRGEACDCVVLDLRLPDMSGFEVLECMRDEPALADVPVVVFTGRELSADEDAQLHTMARSIVVKGVESPERLLDETALFLHRVVADLPAEKQRMLERLNSSDEDLRRPHGAAGRRRRAQHLRAVERAGAARHASAHRHDRPRGDRAARSDAGARHRADGHHDAGNGRLPDDRGHPPQSGLPPPADHRADGQGDEGRPREMPRSRRVRLSRQAGQHRAAALRAADVAASLGAARMSTDKVNILLVDDQPAKLLTNEVILRDLGENLVKASSAREALEYLLKNDVAVVLIDVCMPELDGFELAAMIREHPRFQRTAIIFVSAIQVTDLDRLRGYEMGAVDYVPVPVVPEVLRAKVKVFAELYRKTRQLERLNAELERRVAERTAELEASNARLLDSEQQLRLATEAAEVGLWDVDNVRDTLFWPPRVKAMFGISPDVPVSMADFFAGVHPEDKAATSAAYAAACDPEKRAVYDVEYRTVGKEDGVIRWVAAKGRAMFDADGNCVRVIGTALDITKRKEAEEHQSLLAREVDHRARNALAVIQSIIRLTRANSVDDYVFAIEGRIKALARAHTLLSESRWQGADVRALVTEELAPYRVAETERVVIEGPNISLQPHLAQGLALALHELATNAAKYGALSAITGKVGLRWRWRGGHLVFEWVESGGPRIAPPTNRSFGLNVIRASVEQQLGGKAVFDWAPEGLQCSLAIPHGEVTSRRNADTSEDVAPPPADAPYGRRVLLVEDEALVAMMIQECLTECGHSVIGPINRAADALSAAKNGDFDAAILDINLGDGMAYPIAEILAARGVPFVFLTGYDADTVDSRFGEVPILQKPIERQMLEKIFVGKGVNGFALPS